MSEPAFLLFASDATILALVGAALLMVALIALLGERRRLRRRHIDAVGWMPWTSIFFAALFAAVPLLAIAVRGWLAG